MKYGHIVLVHTKTGIVQKLIRFFTKSKFNHALITSPSIVGLSMCIEAADGDVSVVRFDNAYINNPNENIEIWEVLIDKKRKDLGVISAFDKLETSYGLFEIPWFAWRWLNSLIGLDIKKQDNWCHNGTICSQLCRIYLTRCGLGNLFKGYGRGSLSPQDLSVVLKRHPKYFKKIYSNFSGDN